MDKMPKKQKGLLDRWMKSLTEVPEIDLIWLEGSLANSNRANPVSDIDIRFGISDDAYDQLWKVDPAPLLEGLGEYYPLEWHWRFLTAAEGLIVEIMAFRTSELSEKELFEWEILFSRLPKGEPQFRKLPEQSPAEAWPNQDEFTVERIDKLTKTYLLVLAHSPASFYSGEIHSSYLALDWLNMQILELMYRRIGLSFGKRSKHLSEVLPKEFLLDLDQTHLKSDESPRDLSALAATLLRSFKVLEKHIKALSDEVGGGFEPDWFDRLYKQTEEEFRSFLKLLNTG
jgi:hypothetical protein